MYHQDCSVPDATTDLYPGSYLFDWIRWVFALCRLFIEETLQFEFKIFATECRITSD